MGRAELEFRSATGLKSLGLRPSVFVDIGLALGHYAARPDHDRSRPARPTPEHDRHGVRQPPADLHNNTDGARPGNPPASTGIAGFKEVFLGDSPQPRVSIGFGVNWDSPFGPFRIDIAKALIKQNGDDTKLFTFNVGTAF